VTGYKQFADMSIYFKRFITGGFFFVLPFMLWAQDDTTKTSQPDPNKPWEGKKPNQLKTYGVNALKAGDYYTAVDFLEQFMRHQPENFKIALKLADAYRLSRDYPNAELWYTKVYESDPEGYVNVLFYLGQMQKCQAKYDEASTNFVKFYKAVKGQDDDESKDFRILVSNEIKGCELAKVLMDSMPLNVNIAHLDTTINRPYVEMSPLPIGDSTLMYASLRADKSVYYSTDDDTVKRPVRKFYYAGKEGAKWAFEGEMPGPFNLDEVNTANGAYSPDKKRFYFTRCEKNGKGKMICAIYVSSFSEGKWQEPVKLDESINLKDYTSTQPAVGTDSKKGKDVLYFVSDREDKSRGGLDIWCSVFDSSRNAYSPPRNLGPKINSVGDEMTPFYDNKTRTLYYSSNGFPGMGAMDIFKSTGELSTWVPNENIGYPINSSADDIYYVLGDKKEEGFFVSNRKGTIALRHPTCCDDIFSFKYLDFINIAIRGEVFESSDDSLAGQKVSDVVLSLYLVDSETKQQIFAASDTTGGAGDYLVQLNAGKEYKLVASKEGYLSTPYSFSTRKIHVSDTLIKDFTIPKIPDEKKPFRLENIYYDFNSAELTPAARASIDTTLFVVMVENPELVIELSSHTDSCGSDSYNITLSQKRAESVVRYLIAKQIPKERLVAKGYGETRFIAPNSHPDGSDNPEGRQLNRRTEFAVIGKIQVNEDDNPEED